MSDTDPRPSLSSEEWNLLRSQRFQAGWSAQAISKASQDDLVRQLVEDAYRLGLTKGRTNG